MVFTRWGCSQRKEKSTMSQRIQNIVSIIPARGGSKGIPRKNLVDIHGKPLLYYAVKASLQSKVEETWVSSDDDEILDIARHFGANVLKRPAELAADAASSESVLFHFAEHVEFDRLVFIQATSPLTLPEDINRGIDLLEEYDSVLSVTRLPHFLWINGKPLYDVSHRKMRQDVPKPQFYRETGAFFITTRDNLFTFRNRIGGNIGFCEIPQSRSFDVDTLEELEIVRKLLA